MNEKIITCWKCGHRDSGEYCSHCGAPLQKERVSIGGHFMGSIGSFLNGCMSFLKASWMVLFQPGVYFDSYFKETQPIALIRFPLTRLWRRLSSAPQVSFDPLGLMESSIAFFLAVGTLNRDLGKYMPQQPPKDLAGLPEPQSGDFTFVEIGWINNLINVSMRELAILIAVLIYAFGFSIWVKKQKISLSALSNYCIYSYAAALAVGSCLSILI